MMKQKERKIMPEQYQRAVMLNGSYLTKLDELEVFSDAERIGYGASSGRVFEKDGEFFVNYMISDYCD